MHSFGTDSRGRSSSNSYLSTGLLLSNFLILGCFSSSFNLASSRRMFPMFGLSTKGTNTTATWGRPWVLGVF